MTPASSGSAGATRICPHCRASILESATVCPGCRHHLRFGPRTDEQRAPPSFTALQVDGTIHHPDVGAAWEYSVTLSIRNDRDEEVARQVVGVGALHRTEHRTFVLSVEVFTPAEPKVPVGPVAIR